MKWNQAIRNKLMLPALLGLYICLMVLVSPVTPWQGMKFFLFQTGGMMLPGNTLLHLCKIRTRNAIEESAWSYGLGYIVNLLEYILLGVLHILHWMLPLQILMGFLCMSYLLRRNRRSKQEAESAWKQWTLITVFLTLVVGLRFVTYYGCNLLPTPSQAVTFPTQDLLYYIGNAISATKGFPVAELRFAGEIFKYHYFGSLQLAVAILVTGIDAMTLEFCLAWIQGAVLVVLLFWTLLQRVGIGFRKRLLGMVLLLFTTGWELLVYVAFQHKMYKSPFGWDYGMAFAILTLTFVFMQYQTLQSKPEIHLRDRKQWQGLLLCSLLAFFACAGCKFPIALVLLVVLGAICAIWLFTPKVRSFAFLYGIPLLAVFVLVFFCFVSEGMNTVTTNGSGLKLDLTGHLYECGLGKLYFDWTSQGMPGFLGKIIIIALFFLGCNLVTYYLFALFSLRSLCRGIRNVISFEGCLAAGTCAGLLLTLFTKQSGNSQMYFAMSAFPLAIVSCLMMWEKTGTPGTGKQKNGKTMVNGSGFLFYGCLFLLLLLSLGCCARILQPTVREGAMKLAGRSDFSQESNSLTWEELEGYRWVRDHTEEDAVCLTNVIMEDEQYQSFLVGVCTQRQIYIEGWRYVVGVMEEATVLERRDAVRAFLKGEEVQRDKILADGVDYMVWTKRYGSVTKEAEALLGQVVYENGAVCVYQLEK